MDELKNYFQKHGAEMRVETPDEKGMWERMEARQKQNRPKRVMMIAMRFAAAACILLLVGLGIRQWTRNDEPAIPKLEAQNNKPVKEFVPLQDTIAEEQQPVLTKLEKEKGEQQPLKKKNSKKGAAAC